MGSRTAIGIGAATRGILRGGAVLCLLLPLPGLLEAAWLDDSSVDTESRNIRIEESYQYIKSHLQEPFSGYGEPPGLSVSGWKIAALSHMASGLMSMATEAAEAGDVERHTELSGLLQEVARRAVDDDVSPYDLPVEGIEDFNDWGFYLGHLSLTLGCARYVSGSTEHDALHGRIVRYQMARMSADSDAHSRSYPNSYKWPADQALTLAGAHLYDQIHGTDLSRAPTSAWLSAVEALSGGGLHPFALTAPTALPIDGDGAFLSPLPDAETPRGSALSPTIFYMAQFAPEEAAELYAQYRAERLDAVLGFGGFREWPGAGGSDIEAGPVVFGLGSLATAAGLGPAHLYQDRTATTTILRSALAAGVPSDLGTGRGHLLAPLLGEALLFQGLTARAWFSSPPPLSTDDAPPAAVGAWALLLLDLGLLMLLLLRPAQRALARQRAASGGEKMSETVTAAPTPEHA